MASSLLLLSSFGCSKERVLVDCSVVVVGGGCTGDRFRYG
jgi:hypothetical protein